MTRYTPKGLRWWFAGILSKLTGKPIIVNRNVPVSCSETHATDYDDSPVLSKEAELYETIGGEEFFLISRRRRSGEIRVKLIERASGKAFYMDEATMMRLFRKKEA